MSEVLDIVSNPILTYHQQVLALAKLAENNDDSIHLSEDFKKALDEKIICDLGEGNTPYRPRYITPDYSILMKKGCKFLDLTPPTDLWEATTNLLIMYNHVPSITSFPVYLGNWDELLEEFVVKIDRAEAKKALRLFLLQIDRTLTDSFVHADIGPKDSVTARIILELTEEMQLAIPNLTLKYDPKLTSDDFANRCGECMLKTAKPSFANHPMFVSEWGENYAIASCYNGLKIGGGGYTLPRLRLFECSKKASSVDDFMNIQLPKYIDIMLQYMDQRITFIVEQSNFFKANFLVKEGFLKQENFTGMFGVVGTAECVNHLLNISDFKKGFGNNDEANALGVKIIDAISSRVSKHDAPYCEACGNHYRLHAQVGMDYDGREDSPGARIPVGSEPALVKHLQHSMLFHKYFPTGIGDVFKFDDTWLNTTEALVDIIKGSLHDGVRYFSGYLENNDVVRVTGYLVKKSELAKLDSQEQSINFASCFGQGARNTANALDRRVEDESSR